MPPDYTGLARRSLSLPASILVGLAATSATWAAGRGCSKYRNQARSPAVLEAGTHFFYDAWHGYKSMASRCLITFTSDFGLRDHYVAAVKGSILSVDPQARIIDISHEVRSHDVLEAAFQLLCCYPHFPAGTVHLVVVDPAVGSERKAIAVRTAEQFFVAPDNGVLSLVLRREPARQIVSVEEEKFFRKPLSHTFHGRDVFGPVAAWIAKGTGIAKGTELTDLGPEMGQVEELDLPPMRMRRGRALHGFVLHIDRFGDVITSLRPEDVAEARGGAAAGTLYVGGRRISQQVDFYAEPASEEPFFLVGSSGFFEVAACGRSAAEIVGARVKDEVILET